MRSEINGKKQAKYSPSPLAQDFLQHADAAQANDGLRRMLVDLMQQYGLSIHTIALQSRITVTTLDCLAAGELTTLAFRDATRLLCFYCFMQTRAKSTTAQPRQALSVIPRAWRDAASPLSIRHRERKRQPHLRTHSQRYYLSAHSPIYLTIREYEVAQLIVSCDAPYRLLGERLGLSARTIEYYIMNLRGKLGVANRRELKQVLAPFFQPPQVDDSSSP